MNRTSLARQYEPEDMTEMWKAWQGRTVDGKFLLQEYLGGSDHSAVFLTSTATADPVESGKAVIKVIAAGGDDARQLEIWRTVRDLKHPNLIRILDLGSGEIDGTALLYVVQELAEENLAQIVPERPLTADEAKGMLPPILDALQFVHDKGFVHGSIRPSNILAAGDSVKLACDVVRPSDQGVVRAAKAYDAPEAAAGKISKASDVWQLGITLVEVLTQHLPHRVGSSAPVVPGAVSEPFREIATHCLQIEENKRWSVGEIQDRLAGKQPRPAPALVQKQTASPAMTAVEQSKPSRAWGYVVGVAAIAALAFLLIPRPKQSSTTVAAPTVAPQAQATPTAPVPGAANPDTGTTTSSGDQKPAVAADQDGVVHRELPEVSQSARRTIHGTIQVRVKVKVDASGNVTKGKVESGRASKYFKRLALDAANDWKFIPAEGDSSDRAWKLQFEFSRAKTDATATKIAR